MSKEWISVKKDHPISTEHNPTQTLIGSGIGTEELVHGPVLRKGEKVAL